MPKILTTSCYMNQCNFMQKANKSCLNISILLNVISKKNVKAKDVGQSHDTSP